MSDKVIPFPGQRVMHLVDCQSEKVPEPKPSGIAKYINSFSRPEPKIDPATQFERDKSELRRACCQMVHDHDWTDTDLINFVHKTFIGA